MPVKKSKAKTKPKPKTKAGKPKLSVKSKKTLLKSKPVVKSKAKATAKRKPSASKKIVRKAVSKAKVKKTVAKSAVSIRPTKVPKTGLTEQPHMPKQAAKVKIKPSSSSKQTMLPAKRITPGLVERRKPVKRSLRVNQFAFMKAPGIENEFDVGDAVEVFCDHDKSHERIRGWIKGIVVQVDNKMVAVQFRSNVYLTDGWMVPDRILWYPLTSEHLRAMPGKKPSVKRDFIPDY